MVSTPRPTREWLHSHPAGHTHHHPRWTAPVLSTAEPWRTSGDLEWVKYFQAGPITWGRPQLACCRQRYQYALTTPSPRGPGSPLPPMNGPCAVDCRSLARKLTWEGWILLGRTNGVRTCVSCSVVAAGSTGRASTWDIVRSRRAGRSMAPADPRSSTSENQ